MRLVICEHKNRIHLGVSAQFFSRGKQLASVLCSLGCGVGHNGAVGPAPEPNKASTVALTDALDVERAACVEGDGERMQGLKGKRVGGEGGHGVEPGSMHTQARCMQPSWRVARYCTMLECMQTLFCR
jgi:hypothetical protein